MFSQPLSFFYYFQESPDIWMGSVNSKFCNGYIGERTSQHLNTKERDVNATKLFGKLNETYKVCVNQCFERLWYYERSGSLNWKISIRVHARTWKIGYRAICSSLIVLILCNLVVHTLIWSHKVVFNRAQIIMNSII